ncbi:MAG: hypothetical protein JST81_13650 [Bacteroidetes bacterium]|nr:hypothetical protein [Bacteroidota bacterium]
MGFILKILESLIPGFVSDFLKDKVFTMENLYSLKALVLKKHKYFNELRTLLTDMPFIYKDFDADVLKDFQSIEFKKRDSKQFALATKNDMQSKSKDSPTHKFEAFIEIKKLLFIGSAGVGKSTQMRHIVLSIINPKQTEYFKSQKNLIPIFIQLKGIEPNRKSPIISYILNEIILFKGESGKKEFQKAIDINIIVLILDGYDEIQTIGDEEYIRYEISLLLSFNFSKDQVNERKIDFEYLNFYKGFCQNRVYLTTREEFYNGNTLENFEIPNRDYIFSSFKGSFQAVVLSGLGVLRYNYVKTIFDKYKDVKIYKNKLNAELFIHEIDMSPDEELKSLSQIPLYLTIMCFIYIDHIRNNLEVKEIWNTKIDKLIYECIDTLLNSVDKSKVGVIVNGKLDAVQEAFMKRRSDYPADKLEFLEYYSFDLLLKGESIFGYAYLKKICLYYFQYNSKSKEKDKIIMGLQNSSKSSPDIAWQLINSSIFTTLCLISESYYYDFPHRRFKDVLATKFIERNDQLHLLLENSKNKNLFEFIIYFYANSESKTKKEELIVHLIESIPFDKTNYYNDLVVACIKRKKESNFDEILSSKLIEWVSADRYFKISCSIIDSSIFTYAFISYLYNCLESTALVEFNKLNLILNLLYRYRPELIDTIGEKEIPICKTLLGHVILTRYKLLLKITNRFDSNILIQELNGLDEVQKSFLLASLMSEEEIKRTALLYTKLLSFKERLCFAVCLEKFNPGIASEFKRQNLINGIIFEAFNEILKNNSIIEFQNSAFIKRVNSTIGYYHSQSLKDISFNDTDQKKALIELSSFFDRMSENTYKTLNTSLNYVNDTPSNYLQDFIV